MHNKLAHYIKTPYDTRPSPRLQNDRAQKEALVLGFCAVGIGLLKKKKKRPSRTKQFRSRAKKCFAHFLRVAFQLHVQATCVIFVDSAKSVFLGEVTKHKASSNDFYDPLSKGNTIILQHTQACQKLLTERKGRA